jgi:2-oxo-4-hydroxy-4-carboxy-5-ureidoimidazoline decarboxylase
VDNGDKTPLVHRPAALDLPAFLKIYGSIYESSPWIAEAAYARRGEIETIGQMHDIMRDAVEQGGGERQLALIRAHPDLACGPAVKMTAHSVSEQKGAGLNSCTPEEMEVFRELNAAYRDKFGFPFIIAVKGLTKYDILASFRQRIENEAEQEFRTALQQIHKIALFRLKALSQAPAP